MYVQYLEGVEAWPLFWWSILNGTVLGGAAGRSYAYAYSPSPVLRIGLFEIGFELFLFFPDRPIIPIASRTVRIILLLVASSTRTFPGLKMHLHVHTYASTATNMHLQGLHELVHEF